MFERMCSFVKICTLAHARVSASVRLNHNTNFSVLRNMNEVTVHAPATVANVVCGFDCLGFALNEPFDEMTVRLIAEKTVRIFHKDDFGLPCEAEKNVAGVVLLSMRVLERYVSAIGVRTFAELKDWNLERTDPILSAFERYANKPIINLESAMHHPCQAMADMLTIREKFGKEKKKVLLSWAFHPKPLPMAVPNSFALAAAQFGHDLKIAHPKGYELDDELMSEIENQTKENGGSLEIINDVNEAFEKTEVVYAKSWGSKNFYGAAEKDLEFRAQFRKDWIVDEAKMAADK